MSQPEAAKRIPAWVKRALAHEKNRSDQAEARRRDRSSPPSIKEPKENRP